MYAYITPLPSQGAGSCYVSFSMETLTVLTQSSETSRKLQKAPLASLISNNSLELRAEKAVQCIYDSLPELDVTTNDST